MNILDFFYPPKCSACGKLLEPMPKKIRKSGGDALCPDCRAEWERGKLEKCDYCGRALMDCRCSPRALYKEGCRNVLKLCEYGGDMKKVVTGVIFCLKKQAVRKCELFLATQMSFPIGKFIRENPEKSFCITSLPRRKRGIMLYGYDHAKVLAKELARINGVPYFELLKRTNDGREQKDLDTAGRKENVKGVFSLSKKSDAARGMSIILIDDVITTGASSAECFRALRNGGFNDVTVACIARSMRKKRREI